VKAGDLVVFSLSAVNEQTTQWFVNYAKNRTPMLVVGFMNGHATLLRPDGSQCSIKPSSLEVISENR